MLNAKTVQDGIVARLRDIPALVALVAGDANRIRGLVRKYPTGESFLEAFDDLDPPGILVVWNQTISDFNGGQYQLEFSIISIPHETYCDVDTMQYTIINGIVASTGQKFLHTEPVSDVEIGNFTARIAERDYGDFVLEYPEILVTFGQKWPS